MAKVKKFELEKKYVDYFSVCKHRGLIKTRPTKANGYKIELSDGTIQIEELEDIVTPEQMEQIKKLKRINLKE